MSTLNEEAAIRSILEGTATHTGERFFTALVENLARVLNTSAAVVTEYIPEYRQLRALAFWMDGEWLNGYEYNLKGTPAEVVVNESRFCHFADDVQTRFPDDPGLKRIGAVSYMGIPLTDATGDVLGHLAIIDTKPMPQHGHALTLFRIFAARAGAEVRRQRAESAVADRERKLARLIDTAMDAIIELDENLSITMMNPAAEKVFSCRAAGVIGNEFCDFLTSGAQLKLARLIRDVDKLPDGERYLWIPGGLKAQDARSRPFPAEASLARFDMQRHRFYTLILRSVHEREAADEKIHELMVESQILRREIEDIHRFDDIVGKSKSLRQVLQDIRQVANADATILILGETGTGKELFARAIHNASKRSIKPLIRVNCAAIPVNLIESEFFGHEQGAFTGATKRRDGRFALADRSTIFLDEIGELPLDLQAKLLRVLQEGEFEPVGSAKTTKVDVRVIAATNRNLEHEVKQGKFREDLFYRLNVFPMHVPPLRERDDDVTILATTFLRRCAKKLGVKMAPLSPPCLAALQAYDWPGNVRELENVIERGALTARNGQFNLERALPASALGREPDDPRGEADDTRIRTITEIQDLERTNIVRALKSVDWRVSGDNGAAELLGMNPSTLTSRMKALGISRPR